MNVIVTVAVAGVVVLVVVAAAGVVVVAAVNKQAKNKQTMEQNKTTNHNDKS